MNGPRRYLQHASRYLVLVAIGYQMTAIPVFSGGSEPSTTNNAPAACAPVASNCSPNQTVCAPTACAPVRTTQEPETPGCADDPFRCESCAGCPVWCAVPFLNDFRTAQNIPVLSHASRLQEEPRVWESLILDLLTPPPKYA